MCNAGDQAAEFLTSAGELVEWHLGGEMLVVLCAKMGFLLVS